MSDREQIEEIKDKLDIFTVIQPYVPSLKRSGHNYFGLCPFHREKTPSFSVNPELGLFKCFGCGEGGDVIKFLEKIEGLDFPQALKMAADKAGITLKKSQAPNPKSQIEKEKLLQANKLAADYYNYILFKHELGKPGLEYVKKRQLRTKELQKFLIGYAPKNFENLKLFLNKKGFRDSDLVKWGLLVNKNGKTYDKFRDRLIFPIANHQGEVVGFSGRLIGEENLGPKYLNSPETLVYKKSQLLYGLYQAKEAIRKDNFVILVEGNVDLLSSHAKGIENIVAPLGTALTEEQVKLIKRYCDSIYFALDTDTAGEKALLRGLEITERVGIKAVVLDLGEYQDVDELIVKGGDWSGTVKKPQEVVEYFLEKLSRKYDLAKTAQKAEYIAKILGFIAKLENELAQIDYLRKLSEKVKIELEVLTKDLNNLIAKQRVTATPEAVDLPIAPKSESGGVAVYLLALLAGNRSLSTELKKVNLTEILNLSAPREVLEFLLSGETQLPPNFSPEANALYQEISLRVMPDLSDDPDKFHQEVAALTHRLQKDKIKAEIKELKFQQSSEGVESEITLQRLQELTKQLAELGKSTHPIGV